MASAHEMELLSALHERGFPVPEPILLGQDELLGSCVISAFVPGQPATFLEQPMLPDQLAPLLARLHASNLPRFPWSRSAHEVMHESVMREGSVYDASVDHELLREHFVRRWDTARQQDNSRPGCVLLHGDPWPGNLLVEDGEVRALIDSEEACLGDPMMDVAIARLELHLLFGDEYAARFVDAYRRASKANTDTLADWELAVAARPTGPFDAWEEGFAQMGRADLTARVLRARHAEFVRMLQLG